MKPTLRERFERMLNLVGGDVQVMAIPSRMDIARYVLLENKKQDILSFIEEEKKESYREGREEICKLLELVRCPDPDCDNNGSIACRISDDEWEQQQCQWCTEKRLLLAARQSDTPLKGEGK